MNMIRLLTALAPALLAAAPATADTDPVALDLARNHILVDTHIDAPYRVREAWQDVTRATPDGDFDLPRARAGGLDVAFMSIYTPAELEESGGGFQMANELIDSVEALVTRAPDDLVIVRSPGEARAAFQAGRIGLALGMENGTPLEHKLENVRFFHDRGIRYITLAHSKTNHLSDSSYDENRPLQGLSEFGRAVVREMNRLGVMVDVSHLTDQAFYQVLEVSRAPVIVSHSSARHFTPGFERNISDEMILALAKNGGVVQINFGSTFLTAAAREWMDAFSPQRAAFMEEHGASWDAPETQQFQLDYRAENPFPFATLDDVLDHIDHVVRLVGIDHVGIGSDYDGVGDSLPVGLKDVGDFPALVEGLMKRGYSREDIGKILGDNLLRVWQRVLDHAGNG